MARKPKPPTQATLDAFEIELVNHLRDVETRSNKIYDTILRARKRAEKQGHEDLKRRLLKYQQVIALVASDAQAARLAVRPNAHKTEG